MVWVDLVCFDYDSDHYKEYDLEFSFNTREEARKFVSLLENSKIENWDGDSFIDFYNIPEELHNVSYGGIFMKKDYKVPIYYREKVTIFLEYEIEDAVED